MTVTLNKLCFLIAVVIFVLASLGAWPSVAHDFDPTALGLAFFAAGFLV